MQLQLFGPEFLKLNNYVSVCWPALLTQVGKRPVFFSENASDAAAGHQRVAMRPFSSHVTNFETCPPIIRPIHITAEVCVCVFGLCLCVSLV